MAESPKKITISLAELYLLHDRVREKQPIDEDFAILIALVKNLIIGEERKMDRALEKARKNGGTPNAGDVIDVEGTPIDPPQNDEPALEPHPETTTDPYPEKRDPSPIVEEKPTKPPQGTKPKPKGHGRGGAASFTNATQVYHSLPDGPPGTCHRCQRGPLYRHRSTTKIHVTGQPMFSAEVHTYEQCRCHNCGAIVTAKGPDYVEEGIGKAVVYGYSACAMLIVLHYFAGLPFKRLESLHKSWGIPFADANQWDIVRESDQMLRPLYDMLEKKGMETATSLSLDDTGSMVIEIRRQIKDHVANLVKKGHPTKDVRTGINATGVVLETPQGRVILYLTGLHHAGEIFEKLMRYRDGAATSLIKITDAASKNFDHNQRDQLIETVCHAHLYLAFQKIKTQFPKDYEIAAAISKKVFENERFAIDTQMTPAERRAYHEAHSKPLMQQLLSHCQRALEEKRAEPNSPLWTPVNFVINQWPRLCLFYQFEGIPLHTNLTEQILINVTRYLNSSFNYKSVNGAGVGDRHMSLVVTARANNVEPVAYLTDCLKNHKDLVKNPENYLPWIWRDRQKQQSADPPPDDLIQAKNRVASG